MNIIGLLVALVLVCLLFWAVRAILAAFSIGEPISTIVQVIFVILVVLYILQAVGGLGLGGPSLHLRS